MLYNNIVKGTRKLVKKPKSFFGVGVKSPDTACNARDWYLAIDKEPAYNPKTHRKGPNRWEFNPITKVDTKVYELVEIPVKEIMAKQAEELSRAVQTMLDESAKTRRYDNIVSECSYATSTGTFGTEAQLTVEWRDAVWTYMAQVESDITNGLRGMPEVDDLLKELPTR